MPAIGRLGANPRKGRCRDRPFASARRLFHQAFLRKIAERRRALSISLRGSPCESYSKKKWAAVATHGWGAARAPAFPDSIRNCAKIDSLTVPFFLTS